MIHAFNDRGFDALNPKWRGGTPHRISEQTRDWICVIARCDPRFLSRPFSCWSLSKLRDYLIETGRVTTAHAWQLFMVGTGHPSEPTLQAGPRVVHEDRRVKTARLRRAARTRYSRSGPRARAQQQRADRPKGRNNLPTGRNDPFAMRPSRMVPGIDAAPLRGMPPLIWSHVRPTRTIRRFAWMSSSR
ncbi:helix-turn-helix domain-containing protein [Micromonospora craterilacus]|uniref:helix-turn-helix domain-containing protein n=1 Tax=Micromonospora craterilacus TaxID=1655439 RepID=UPI001F3381F6|nr:helix-turn-helix domain-containing protein [Micromonospora craterilacus]